jgi:hypothetical protein
MSDAPEHIFILNCELNDSNKYQPVAGVTTPYTGDACTQYTRADLVETKNARIAELEAALALFIKYHDEFESGNDVQLMIDYANAIEAAKAAMKDKPL